MLHHPSQNFTQVQETSQLPAKLREKVASAAETPATAAGSRCDDPQTPEVPENAHTGGGATKRRRKTNESGSGRGKLPGVG